MKVAVIGSRQCLNVCMDMIINNLPLGCSEIVTGGAQGIDTLAQQAALSLKIKINIIKPDYPSFGKAAPLKRNLDIIAYADTVLAFWDFKSKGTQFIISECIKIGKSIKVIDITKV